MAEYVVDVDFLRRNPQDDQPNVDNGQPNVDNDQPNVDNDQSNVEHELQGRKRAQTI